MPKPFSRPSIFIGSDKKRVWQHIPVEDVVVGDTIAEFGEVDTKWVSKTDVLIVSTFKRSERLDLGTMVHAYVMPSEDS